MQTARGPARFLARAGSDPDAPPKKLLRGLQVKSNMQVGFGAVTVVDVECFKEELAALRCPDDAPSFIACGQCDGRFSKAGKEILKVGKGEWFCRRCCGPGGTPPFSGT